MKYTNLKAFEQASSRIYLVSIPDSQERLSLLEATAKRVLPLGCSLERFSPDQECRELFDALSSPSLFGGEAAILLDECQDLKKKDVESLVSFLEKGALFGFLFLGSSGKTPLAKVVEKVGSFFDMSEEKPWDKEKRISETLASFAKGEGRWLAPDAISLLLERLGPDLSLLMQEVRKLICYVGDNPAIGRSEVFRASPMSLSQIPWKVAEEIVWEGRGTFDVAMFHPLLFSIRSQLQIGLKMTTLLEEGISPSEWAPYFPKMWPKTLEKRRSQASLLGSAFFKKGLDVLFKVESLSRTSSSQLEALFDLLRGSLCR